MKMILVPSKVDEKGMWCKSAAAHSTVREDESHRPLPEDHDLVGRRRVGMSPKPGDLPVNIVKSFGEDERIHKKKETPGGARGSLFVCNGRREAAIFVSKEIEKFLRT